MQKIRKLFGKKKSNDNSPTTSEKIDEPQISRYDHHDFQTIKRVLVALEVKDEEVYQTITDVSFVFPDDTIDYIDAIRLFRLLSASIQRNNTLYRDRTISLFTNEQQLELRKVLLTQPQADNIDWKLLLQLINPYQYKWAPTEDDKIKTISEDGRTVTLTSANNNHNTSVTRPINPTRHKNLFFYIEAKVITYNTAYNWSFGIADGHFPRQTNFIGYSDKTNTPNTVSYGFSSDGYMRRGDGLANIGAEQAYSLTGHTSWKTVGARVGQLVNFRDNSITFFVNGEKVPVEAHESGKMLLEPFLHHESDYFFSTTMFSSNDTFQLCDTISINYLDHIYPLIKELTNEGVVLSDECNEE
jgi:hypothetical protein